MRSHNGMRPQDIPILLKCSIDGSPWQISHLSRSMSISISEISESLNRSMLAGLIDHSKKKVNRSRLLEFLEHGVKYVFPQELGPMVRGIPTAHSHPAIQDAFVSGIPYVWPDPAGSVIGQAIEPFYARQVEAVKQDEQLYKLLALVDMIRVGKAREVKYAVEQLKKTLAQ